MARDKKKKSQAAERRRVVKKKTSILSSENIEWVDYKDVNLLRRFMSERAKIRARRVTGNSAQQQRAVARAIRIAREMALLPYSVRQVTQRSRGGRRDRDRMPEIAPDAEAVAAGAGDGGAGEPGGDDTAADVAPEVAAEAAGAEAEAPASPDGAEGEDES
jgi:small subunit ribosomal protein S18